MLPSTANIESFIENLPNGASIINSIGDTMNGMMVNHSFKTCPVDH